MHVTATDQGMFAAYQARLTIDVAVIKEARDAAEQQGDAAIALLEDAAALAQAAGDAARASRGIDLLA